MNSKLLTLLFAISVFTIGCNGKDDSNSEIEEVKVPTTVSATPQTQPITPDIPKVPSLPPVPPVDTPSEAVHPGAGKVTLWDRSTSYDCAVFLPADYGKDPNKQYPMILSLHGLKGSVLNIAHTAVGGTRTGFVNQVWGTTLAKTFPAIVIAPNWSPAGSASSGLWIHSQLRQVIIDALAKYNVDKDRVVATGLSAGSIGTQELIKYSKDLLAGAMPAAYASIFTTNYCQLADIPVWVFGNTSDTLFKSDGWQAQEPKIQACANYIHEFKLTVYENTCGHGCWDRHWAKPEVQEWLISQKR